MLDLPVPKLEGGKPQTIVAHPNDEQKAYMKVLAERSEWIHSGAVDPSKDNMLKITGEARLLGLDARCVIPNAENYPASKVNLCIDKIMEIYDRTSAERECRLFSAISPLIQMTGNSPCTITSSRSLHGAAFPKTRFAPQATRRRRNSVMRCTHSCVRVRSVSFSQAQAK